MRRSDHPSRPKPTTCCFFSSFKTLLTTTEGIALASTQRPECWIIVGRFSGDYVWPVLGDHRGQTSDLFYQVISTRHSHKRSTVITTNTAFSDWGNILFNTTIATAIADRLVENSEIFLLGGDSLRKSKNPNRRPSSCGRLRASAALCDNPSRR